jgi:glycine/D-amino acid oxidase-like deaminating enzyme
MSTDAVRAVLRSSKYYQALYDPACFHFHPLNYARSLARAIEALNGKVFEGSRVIGCDLDGAEKIVRTAGGEVRARDVILAGGGYTDGLVPRLRRSILPISTYVLLTEPAPERIADAVRTPMAISDNRRAGDYYRLVDDGARLLWGGRITTRTTEPRRLAAMMQKTMASTYPQLEGVRVETAWSGLMAYARHLMPLIGQLQPGVWYAFGFGGRGMNTTAIGGRVIAEGVLGLSDRYRLFEPFDLAWNGGPFGIAAAQLTYWTYQALDLARERRAARAA